MAMVEGNRNGGMVMDWSRGMAMVEGNRNGGMVMDWSRGMAMVIVSFVFHGLCHRFEQNTTIRNPKIILS
jgi:hypothetical protein